MPSIRVESLISSRLALVPDVESVWKSREGRVFYVWSVVNHSSADVRRRVYEKEREIIDELQEYEFDFSIFARRDRDSDRLFMDRNLQLAFSRASTLSGNNKRAH